MKRQVGGFNRTGPGCVGHRKIPLLMLQTKKNERPRESKKSFKLCFSFIEKRKKPSSEEKARSVSSCQLRGVEDHHLKNGPENPRFKPCCPGFSLKKITLQQKCSRKMTIKTRGNFGTWKMTSFFISFLGFFSAHTVATVPHLSLQGLAGFHRAQVQAVGLQGQHGALEPTNQMVKNMEKPTQTLEKKMAVKLKRT